MVTRFADSSRDSLHTSETGAKWLPSGETLALHPLNYTTRNIYIILLCTANSAATHCGDFLVARLEMLWHAAMTDVLHDPPLTCCVLTLFRCTAWHMHVGVHTLIHM